jgi:glycosyltransferase involved in cell wall biosynthesis
MNATRVVITVPWGERLGGAENILWTFLRHVDRNRIDPIVVFLQQGAFHGEVASLGVRTAVVPSGRLRNVRLLAITIRNLSVLMRNERPDVILNWAPKMQLYGAPAASLAGMAGRVMWWQQGIPRGEWMDRLATLLPSRAVGCYSAAAEIGQLKLWPRRKTFVVHPGIDDTEPIPAPEAASLRERLGIPAGRVVVGIVGRLQPWKGQHRLLEAVAELVKGGRDVHALLVGGNAYNLSPEYEPFLRRLVDELGLGGRATFTGQVADAGPYGQLMDISVNASDDEPFGLVIIEAMALGVPVVAFASAGPAEIIESDLNGILVPKGEPLTAGLDRLVASPELRRSIGSAGRRRFLDAFTAERMTNSLESALCALAERDSPVGDADS